MFLEKVGPPRYSVVLSTLPRRLLVCPEEMAPLRVCLTGRADPALHLYSSPLLRSHQTLRGHQLLYTTYRCANKGTARLLLTLEVKNQHAILQRVSRGQAGYALMHSLPWYTEPPKAASRQYTLPQISQSELHAPYPASFSSPVLQT